jgi:putative tRNA adenosine deaminase-associated protein
VSFFTAVMASDGESWRAKDVDVEDCASLDDLVELMQGVAHDDCPVLCVIEREDGWFGLVRVNGDDPATIFVSDLPAVLAGHYAELLGSAADVDVDVPVGVHAYEREKSEPEPDDRLDAEREHDAEAEEELVEALGGGALLIPDPDPEPIDLWAGDPGMLSDLGLSAQQLVALVTENPDDPATALNGIGEVLGFDELIEALR